MSKRLLACVLGALALLLAAPAVALAEDSAPAPTGVQTADQSATSGQGAIAASEATQTQPSNTNIPIRVGSDGSNGSVTQSNDVSSKAEAENDNETTQDADQSQSGSGGIQTSDQTAENTQLAAAKSTAAQWGASNTNIGIRVFSSGDDGSVTQSNDVSSKAEADNDNETTQDADQSQSGSGSGGIQTADQTAENTQIAAAKSEAVQKEPKNTNISIRVGSDGNNGDVTQSNSVYSKADADNDNSTDQDVDQSQGASGKSDCGCSASQAGGVQTADQTATNTQAALAGSTAVQEKPKNVNISIRVFSDGDDGDVYQSNTASSKAKATNDNETTQDVDQSQGGSSGKGHDGRDAYDGKSDCGCSSGTGIQTADQKNASAQFALAGSAAVQKDAKNVNLPIRVGSEGDNGSVDQSNSVSSKAKADNDNETDQDVDQTIGSGGKGSDCGCKDGEAIQVAKQSNGNLQAAAAFSLAKQEDAKNVNKPIRVYSDGDNGDVYQSNDVSSKARASNDNETDQDIDQTVGSGKGHDDWSRDGKDGHDGKGDCGCSGGKAIQTADQWNGSAQGALAGSAAIQKDAKNVNAPIRVKSDGDNGSVDQSNDVSSKARASNDNETDQDIDQSAGSGSGEAIQVAKQGNLNLQGAAAFSLAAQKDAKNVNAPIRVKSKGDDGDVYQSNDVSSKAKATNDNETDQDIDQTIGSGSSKGHDDWGKDGKDGHDGKGDCGCPSGTAIQTADQKNASAQFALAGSAAVQKDATNVNKPIRVLSKGDGGTVDQSNDVSSTAKASNDNETDQDIDQTIGSGKGHDWSRDGKDGHDGKSDCGCSNGEAIQVADQSNLNLQKSAAFSLAAQKDAKNVNAPIRVKSKGDDGDVYQSNDVSSKAKATNDNETDQDIDQTAGSGSGLGVQVAYQTNASAQLAAAASAALQKGATNDNSPTRVYSKGDGGTVDQSNSVSSKAKASNDNETDQDVDQTQKGGHDCKCADGIGIQVAGQKNLNEQAALAKSFAVQDFGKSECGCHSGGNSNSPVRVYSKGDDGDVTQSNDVSSKAKADNDNETDQDVDQKQFGGSGIGIQVAAQQAHNAQLAGAFSAAAQLGARNDNSPTRVYSKGDGGSVDQSNDVSSRAKASNDNDTEQDVDQFQGGHGKGCGCSDGLGIQVAGQKATNLQIAAGLSAAFQLKPENSNAPVSVWSKNHGGSVDQSNSADSRGKAENDNRLEQMARQFQL